MSNDKNDSRWLISVQLIGKNYSYWSYVMKKNLKKKMWNYVDGTSVKPIDKRMEQNIQKGWKHGTLVIQRSLLGSIILFLSYYGLGACFKP